MFLLPVELLLHPELIAFVAALGAHGECALLAVEFDVVGCSVTVNKGGSGSDMRGHGRPCRRASWTEGAHSAREAAAKVSHRGDVSVTK